MGHFFVFCRMHAHGTARLESHRARPALRNRDLLALVVVAGDRRRALDRRLRQWRPPDPLVPRDRLQSIATTAPSEVIAAWIDHYHRQRPHQALGYLTPREYREERA